ncbi:MAG: helix-turn-helix domain-containing protein [Candidatus Xenobiia bacterium LiM19]
MKPGNYRELINGLEDLIGNEAEFDRRLDEILNDWEAFQVENLNPLTPLTPEKVAEILNISVKTLKQWLREGRIKGVKVGREWRIMQRDLVNYLEGLTSPELTRKTKEKILKKAEDKEQ